jgi:hypothetical protein
MAVELSIAELQEKIAKYKSMGETELAAKYQAELDSKSKGTKGTPVAGDIVLGISPEDFEKATSKFAAPGLHKSVFGMPYWKTAGKSLSFPYIIVEGEDEGKEGEIFCGISKEAAWKIKEILKSLAVSYKNQNGLVAFNPTDVAGKFGKVLYAQVKDTRPADEGGKGTIYTKPVEGSNVFPADATLESIGMTMSSLLYRELA